MKPRVFCCLTIMVMFFCSAPAIAHKINIFAFVDGDRISGETSFSGGRAAQHADIFVEDPVSGTLLLQTSTDEQGGFSFVIPDEYQKLGRDVRIVVAAGDGHRNHWTVRADEFLSERRSAPTPAAPVAAAPPATPLPHADGSTCDEATLRRLIDDALSEHLLPMKRMLGEAQATKPRLRDIFGGLGYIVGIFGVIALIKTKKGEHR